jgi:hypothetical protein
MIIPMNVQQKDKPLCPPSSQLVTRKLLSTAAMVLEIFATKKEIL